MTETIRLLDVVALSCDLPEEGLCRGQVGTVVETLASDTFEVAFVDTEGQTYAMLPLRRDQFDTAALPTAPSS